MGSLGIYEGHNAGVSYVDNGELLLSVEEERFSRIKQHDGRNISHGLPSKSLKWVLSQIKNKSDITSIGIALEEPSFLRLKSLDLFIAYAKRYNSPSIISLFSDVSSYRQSNDPSINNNYILTDNEYMDLSYSVQSKRLGLLSDLLYQHGLSHVDTVLESHHKCHHASSWFTSGASGDFMSLSLDGRGDALSGLITLPCDSWPFFETADEISSFDSVGHFYSAVTAALGYVPVKHEGKITGLAAYGQIQDALLTDFENFISISPEGLPISSLISTGPYGPYPYANTNRLLDPVKSVISGYTKEDVAATAQHHLESIVCKLVTLKSQQYSKRGVLLSGGVFANVKLNQRISELPCLDYVIVHPGMTDCGLSVGAAFLASSNSINKTPHLNYYLGPSYSFSEDQILSLLPQNKYNVYTPKSMAKDVAELLVQDKVVARFSGQLEYGPRALGNRSILCNASDPDINNWLNEKLSRTEFMPFAPVTIAEDADKSYEFPPMTDLQTSLKFMTITVNCKPYLSKHCPAVVHVDGTARPQIILKNINPEYYAIINEYKSLTGIGTLVNTSFNIHDQPIVCNPEEALLAFQQSDLDALILNDHLIVKR